MDIKRVCALYFSPTGGTEKIARILAGELAGRLGIEPEYISLTAPAARRREYRFGPEDLVVAASPVYAGRLPNKIMPDYKAGLWGENTPAVPLCVFGNRSCGEALREWVLLLEENGFQAAGAAAFAARHAFSDRVGDGRPDWDDRAQIKGFAAELAGNLAAGPLRALAVDRGGLGPYYTPLKADGTPASFLKARPLTDWGKCSRCGACARACPVGSIDGKTMESVGLCIKCQACVRRCTVRAKYFADRDFLSHVAMLEQTFTERAENLILLP